MFRPETSMTAFEYLKIDLNSLPPRRSYLDVLNAEGAKGWELISISPVNIATLKRPMGPSAHEDDLYGDEEPITNTAAIKHEMETIARSSGFALEDILEEAQVAKRPVAVKYRDPNNPANTWTGRGRMPLWLVAATEGGRAKKEDFLI
jgi:hypothetical protein